jgi:hypothetical protein
MCVGDGSAERMQQWTAVLWELIQATYAPEAYIYRQDLLTRVLPTVVSRVGSVGVTPGQTLSRELQRLRDLGLLTFHGRGCYSYPRPVILLTPDNSSHGEAAVVRVLTELSVVYEREKRFTSLRGTYGGKPGGYLRFDFYIVAPRRAVIEFDGEQHDRAVEW